MANDGIPVTFLDVHCNSFYFSEEKNDFEADDFKKAGDPVKYLIKSSDSKYLILNAVGDFQFENFTGHQFNIQHYRSTALEQIGKAVMLYAYKDQQKMVACCRGGSEIYAKPMEFLTDIPTTEHEALFIMEGLSTDNSYRFQSTVNKGWYLGFQPDYNNHSRHKLVLIHNRDDVDKFCPLDVTECKE